MLRAEGFQEVDLLRVSVLGREYAALLSAEQWLRSGRVRAMALSVLRDSLEPAGMALRPAILSFIERYICNIYSRIFCKILLLL